MPPYLSNIILSYIRCFYYNEHLVWLDGCIAQFKSKHIWYHVAQYMFAKTFNLLIMHILSWYQFI